MAIENTEQVEPLLASPLESLVPPAGTTDIKIPSSESFTFDEVGQFLCAEAGTLVALLGDRDSGKSTLICSIYDRFLRGPFAGCESSGIRTITGLERRAHLERLESGRDTPDTQHTSIAEGLQYFHFPVVRDESGGRTDLFISDRAGELYKDARGNSSLVGQLIEVPAADYIVVLIDGARLASPELRAGAFFAVRQSLQMLTDRNALGSSDRVQVVMSKVDLIEGAEDATALKDRLTDFKEKLVRDFGNRLGRLEFLDVAARDPQGSYAAAHGVDILLKSWLGGPKVRTRVTAVPAPIVTEFDKLSARPEVEVSEGQNT